MYGETPPVSVPVNEAGWFAVGWVGVRVKLAVSAGMGTTLTVCVDFEVALAPSVTVRVTE